MLMRVFSLLRLTLSLLNPVINASKMEATVEEAGMVASLATDNPTPMVQAVLSEAGASPRQPVWALPLSVVKQEHLSTRRPSPSSTLVCSNSLAVQLVWEVV